MRERRGVPIGAFSSQPIGNLSDMIVDRAMKEKMHCKHYVRYCDDVTGMTRTKAEAHRQLKEYIRISEELGLVVKSDFTISKIAGYEKKRKRRKRQRGSKRKSNRLSRLSVLQAQNSASQINEATLCQANEKY